MMQSFVIIFLYFCDKYQLIWHTFLKTIQSKMNYYINYIFIGILHRPILTMAT